MIPASLLSPSADAAAVRARFAVLRPGQRIWAIGAVHGDLAGLVQLHDRLAEAIGPGERLVYLGNLLGISGNPAGVLDEVLDFRCRLLARPGAFHCDVVLLRGQQEEMWSKLMQLQFAPKPQDVLRWLMDSGVGPTLSSYGLDPIHGERAARESVTACARWTAQVRGAMADRAGHRELFSALKRAAITRDGMILLVAAGLNLAKTLDAMTDEFWWGGPVLDRLVGGYGDVQRIVRGHQGPTAVASPDGVLVTLDGGAGRGGQPMAGCFDHLGQLVGTL